MIVWNSDHTARITGGVAIGSWQAQGIVFAPERARRGALFVPRSVQEGRDAFKEGVAAVLVDRKFARQTYYHSALVVPDLDQAVTQLAKSARRRSKARIVAVAGGLGKTTLARLLDSALIGQAAVTLLRASDHMSLQRALASLPQTGVACVELHAKQAGQLAPMISGLRPGYLALVSSAPRHLDRFDSTLAMAKDSALALRALPKGAYAALPVDDEHWQVIKRAVPAKIHTMSYGTRSCAHHRVVETHFHSGVTTLRARGWRTPMLLKLGGEGVHFACLALGALTIVRMLGHDGAMAIVGMSGWRARAGYGRHRVIPLDAQLPEESIRLIDASRHSDPCSLSANLDTLMRQPKDPLGPAGRRIAVLGPMPGLGESSARYYGQIGEKIATGSVDLVHRLGANMAPLEARIAPAQMGLKLETARELLPHLRRLWRRGDIVLVQGERGGSLDQVVDAMRKLGHRRRIP